MTTLKEAIARLEELDSRVDMDCFIGFVEARIIIRQQQHMLDYALSEITAIHKGGQFSDVVKWRVKKLLKVLSGDSKIKPTPPKDV